MAINPLSFYKRQLIEISVSLKFFFVSFFLVEVKGEFRSTVLTGMPREFYEVDDWCKRNIARCHWLPQNKVGI